MSSHHLILCCSLLLSPSIFPSVRVFSKESVLHIRSQSIRASASVLPMNIQDWFPLGLTGWISLQSKGLSRVFSNTTVQKHQFFSTQLSLWSGNHLGNFINTHVSDLAPLIRISFVWGMFWASGFHLFIYFGASLCAETSSLHGLFSNCSELLSNCSEQASHCNGFSCCVAWALECIVFSSSMHGLKVAAPRCYSTGSIVVAQGLYSSIACDSWAREQTCAFCTGR